MAKKISTKDKVLKAALKVFSENGYKETTVRMISEKAGVNIASVNYYFGDKEQLYLEVVRYWAKEAFKDFPSDDLTDPELAPEKKIESFIYSTLISLLGKDGKGTGFGRLMALEASVSPSDVVHQVVSETIKAPTDLLRKAVSDLSGITDEERLAAYTAAIVGQTVYIYLSKNLIEELFGVPVPSSEAEILKLSRYISDITLHALQ